MARYEKHTSRVKTPVPWGCLIAGDSSRRQMRMRKFYAVGRGFIPGFESAKIRGLQALRYALWGDPLISSDKARMATHEKHTSGVKTPVPWGCLIAGDQSPAYRSRPACFSVSGGLGFEDSQV
jgi:hypothetical protein